MSEQPFDYFVGLDVSQRTTAICVIDISGNIIREASVNSDPHHIHKWLKSQILDSNKIASVKSIRIGLEAGSISHWLQTGLCQFGLDVICLETFQAHRFLATFHNKTDKNDARGLAQLLRLGGDEYLRVVQLKSKGSLETRTLLSNRNHLVKFKVSLENHLSGSLKPYGAIIQRSNCRPDVFRKRILEAVQELEQKDVCLKTIFAPILLLHDQIMQRINALTQQAENLAKEIPTVRRFMEIPGVGAITALSFYSAVDQPDRFKKSTDVAAYFGLTPKQVQSGDTDYNVGISKRGDAGVRRTLVVAATVLLTRTKNWCSLKAWGLRLAARIGMSKARIAVARKLAIIMHRMWLKNDRWRPVPISAQERVELKKRLDKSVNKKRNYKTLDDCIIDEYGEIVS